jgi:hypothetical protein
LRDKLATLKAERRGKHFEVLPSKVQAGAKRPGTFRGIDKAGKPDVPAAEAPEPTGGAGAPARARSLTDAQVARLVPSASTLADVLHRFGAPVSRLEREGLVGLRYGMVDRATRGVLPNLRWELWFRDGRLISMNTATVVTGTA